MVIWASPVKISEQGYRKTSKCFFRHSRLDIKFTNKEPFIYFMKLSNTR